MKIANKSIENSELEQEQSQKKIGSLDQFQFVLYASKDKRLNACDLAVLFEITDRFLKKDGITYPTGSTHLARETGRNVKTVKASRAKLLKFHYLQVGEPFQGSTGTAYLPNFKWSSKVADAIKTEVAARAAKRKSRKSSGGLPTPTKAPNLVGGISPPLDGLVGGISPPLRDLVGVPRPPETYVGPTSPYVGGVHTPVHGLSPVPGAPPRLWKIIDSSVEHDAGEMWMHLRLEDDSGASDEASICLESSDASRQAAGQKTLARLTNDLDGGIDGSEDLHGMWVFFDAQFEVQPAPANDNANQQAAA